MNCVYTISDFYFSTNLKLLVLEKGKYPERVHSHQERHYIHWET